MTTITSHSHLAESRGGAVVLPDDHRYDEARSSFNLLSDQRPAAVARELIHNLHGYGYEFSPGLVRLDARLPPHPRRRRQRP